MKLEYWFEMPNKWTFEMKKLRSFIMKFIHHNSIILLPFAGKYRFGNIDNSQFVYNDLNTKIKANTNIDACKLNEVYYKDTFDCIIADPPYSHYQAITTYNNKKIQKITIWRKIADYLLKPGGIYIELGYNSAGIKKYEKIALGICQLGGSHNDILVLVQKKPNNMERWL